MLIICPSCATSYNVKPGLLGLDGRRVRCVRCETVWHAVPPAAQKLLAAADAIGAPMDAREADRAAEAAPESHRRSAAATARLVAAQGWVADPGREQWAERQPMEDLAAQDQPEPAGQSPQGEPAPFPQTGEADPTLYAVENIQAVDLDAGQPVIVEADASPAEDIESFAARRTRRAASRRRAQWPLSRLQTAILMLVVVNSLLIGWRGDVVRLLPQTASFYASIGLPVNLRGLSFDGVDIVTEQHEGVPVLVVEGHIVNDARRTVEVPRLKFAVRNAAGQEVYSWTAVPPRTVLHSREAVAFRSRLASPPPETRDVLVRFLNRRDLVANMR
jgi:predicted Zn finger-like uncharacterized protein